MIKSFYEKIQRSKLVILFLCDEPPIKCAKTLWTNNKQNLLTFKEHFETNWNKATCYPVVSI